MSCVFITPASIEKLESKSANHFSWYLVAKWGGVVIVLGAPSRVCGSYMYTVGLKIILCFEKKALEIVFF